MRRESIQRLEKRLKAWEDEYFFDKYRFSSIAPKNIESLKKLIELRRNELQWTKRGTNK